MQIIVPMAGLGQRFRDAGYATPKPLLPVNGQPMVVRVVRDLPEARRIVFVVHPQHLEEQRIDRLLRQHFPHADIVATPGLTQGQACSVALAQRGIDPDDEVIVAACDNTHIYDEQALARLTRSGADCLIWTYRGERRVLEHPHWYGWVQTNGSDQVTKVSVKQPISERPLEDHVVSGTFWFRTARQLFAGIEALVNRGERVNNEFYLDAVPNLMLAAGKDVRTFEVHKYIGWGTPADYEQYTQRHRAA